MSVLQLSWLFLITLLTNFGGINMVLVSGQCQSDQQSLLLQMKSSLDLNSLGIAFFGKQSTRNQKLWSQSNDCCTWSGVDCDEAGRVIGLDLSEESISAGIDNSSSLFSLKYLQSLNLAYNSFNGSQIPSGLGNLTNLTYLNVSNAGFAGQIPIQVSGMTRPYPSFPCKTSVTLSDLSLFSLPMLQQLQLANNKFGGPIPEFSNASYSALSTLDLTAIQRLGNLTRLELSYNNLTVNASSDSSFPSQVSRLRLASCKLRVIPDLKNQSKLSYLDLSDNQIYGEIPNWVWEIGNGNLVHLNLSHNLLASLQRPYNISDLTCMTVLDLHSNQLQGNIP
ncbi:Receptor-like protein 47 [Citrus sinensis]|nr:Receptor-like protein 47 [Citrus sinensis]